LSGRKINFQKAFSINAMDTTGAGDVYHGAYIYGLLQGWNMRKCMRFASVASAIKCTQIGARKGIPQLEEIKEFMRGK
jgi:sulfofructose kinase